jgi:hypothetical protein
MPANADSVCGCNSGRRVDERFALCRRECVDQAGASCGKRRIFVLTLMTDGKGVSGVEEERRD